MAAEEEKRKQSAARRIQGVSKGKKNSKRRKLYASKKVSSNSDSRNPFPQQYSEEETESDTPAQKKTKKARGQPIIFNNLRPDRNIASKQMAVQVAQSGDPAACLAFGLMHSSERPPKCCLQ